MHAWSIAQGRLTTPYWISQIDHYYPPLYPALISLVHLLIPSWPGAAKAVSVAFSVLLLIPVYALARTMFSREVAVLAAASTVAYPMLVQTGSNAYAEPVYLFCLALSMFWGWRMIAERSGGMALLSGIGLGLAYLARPQAVAGLVSLAFALLWFWLMRRQLRSGQFVRFLVLILAGFYLFALPYELYNHRKDGVWGLRSRIAFFEKGAENDTGAERNLRERTLNRDATALLPYDLARDTSPVGFVVSHPKTYLGWLAKDFTLVARKAFLERRLVPPVVWVAILLLVAGLAWNRETRLRDAGSHLYLLFWFVPLLLLVPLSITVVDRRFIPLIICLCIWAAAGVEQIRAWCEGSARLDAFGGRLSLSGIGLWVIPLLLLQPHSFIGEMLEGKTVINRAESDWLAKNLGGAKRRIIMSPDPYQALATGNYWLLQPLDNINRVGRYLREEKPDFLLADSRFFSGLDAPADYVDQYLGPFSKPGLDLLARGSFEPAAPSAARDPKVEALYRVANSRTFVPPRVNVILISIDTLRADHMSCYGYPLGTTPSIDRIASEGVRFAKVITQAPKTAPSHMTMFTSLYPEVHGVYKPNDENVFVSLNPTWKTLPEILKAYGYHTAAFTGGGQVGRGFGFDRGFDLYKEGMGRLGEDRFNPVFDWLSKVPTQEPFFLFLHTYQVHDPYLPPAPFNAKYDPDYTGWVPSDRGELMKLARDDDKFPNTHRLFWGQEDFRGDDLDQSRITPRDARHYRALYDGGIAFTDQMLGRFFDELRKRAILGNAKTILIIVGDHGEEFREHGDFLHKRLYRETVTVPMIFDSPGALPAGREVKGQVRLLDLAPTILDLLGAPVPVQMQGVSLKDGILNGRDVFLNAYSEDNFYKRQYSIRTPEFLYYRKEFERKTELYRITADPDEVRDLLWIDHAIDKTAVTAADDAASIADACQRSIDNFHLFNNRHREIFEVGAGEGKKVGLGVEQIKRLRALGYVN